jgi:hypothetical protein
MALAPTSPPPSTVRGRCTAFGLDVWPDSELPFLGGGTLPTGRRLELRRLPGPEGLPALPGAIPISDEREPGGGRLFRIEEGATGYRIDGPRYGETFLAADGSSVLGCPGAGGLAAWQRLLIAQVLPFAAVLRGLEVLHAGAVAIEDGAVVLLGTSGAGKTSLAAALERRGATFLCDDVLAVESREGRLVGHPGAPVAGIARAELERLRRDGGLGGRAILAEDEREAMVRAVPHPRPAEVRASFLLDRRPDGPERPRFEPLRSPQLLLASTFNLVLLGAMRLQGLLDVCALLAGSAEHVVFGPATGPAELAAAIEARLEAPR